MGKHVLNLNARADAWRLYALRKVDPAFAKIQKRVLVRDHNTCQFCGFQAQSYQDVVNLDHNYKNNKLINLVTACCFCAQCLFLETVGKGEYGGGTIIYLPEMSQAELNGFCHVLFCAIAGDASNKEDAQNIYRTLKMRAKVVEKVLGEGMSVPAVLGQVLIESRFDNKEEVVTKTLADLRLLPARDKFNDQLAAWAMEAT